MSYVALTLTHVFFCNFGVSPVNFLRAVARKIIDKNFGSYCDTQVTIFIDTFESSIVLSAASTAIRIVSSIPFQMLLVK